CRRAWDGQSLARDSRHPRQGHTHPKSAQRGAASIGRPDHAGLHRDPDRDGRAQTDMRNQHMSKLTDKVAIVTGASKGIGASIATHLADEGAAVVVNYASSKDGADRVVAEITRQGGRAIAVQANLASPADITRLFSETMDTFGRLDILVNNAGVYEFQPLENITEEHFHRHFNVNVLGLLLASKEAVKHF